METLTHIVTKEELRKEAREKTGGILLENYLDLSKQAIDNLSRVDEFRNANSFFIYVSTRREVRTHELIWRLLEKGKIVTVPKILEDKVLMEPYQINDWLELEPGRWSILTPLTDKPYKENIDVCIIPMLAFAKHDYGGYHRLGTGGGYYDRFISAHPKTINIALAFNLQQIPYICAEEHDQLVQIVVTESEVMR